MTTRPIKVKGPGGWENVGIVFPNYAIDSDVVHLAGDETVAGNKTFTGTTLAGSALPPTTGKLNAKADAGGVSLALSDNTNSSLYVKHAAGAPVTIGTDGGGALAFATNGFTEAMRIDSAGRVGIGAEPAFPLSVNINAPATWGNTADNFAQMWTNSGTNALGVAIGDDLIAGFTTNNGYALNFAVSGTEFVRLVSGTGVVAGTGHATATPGVIALQGAWGAGTNIAGANLELRGGKSTGTGVGGSILLRTSPAGSTGSAQNDSVTRLTVDSTGLATFANDVTVSGVFRETVTKNTQTTNYILVLTDRGKLVEMNVGSANTLTVPPNIFPDGSVIEILQIGAGKTQIVAGNGVTINSTPGLYLRAQWSGATLINRGGNVWVLVGDTSVS